MFACTHAHVWVCMKPLEWRLISLAAEIPRWCCSREACIAVCAFCQGHWSSSRPSKGTEDVDAGSTNWTDRRMTGCKSFELLPLTLWGQRQFFPVHNSTSRSFKICCYIAEIQVVIACTASLGVCLSSNICQEKEKEKVRRQWKPLPTLIKEKEPLLYRIP